VLAAGAVVLHRSGVVTLSATHADGLVPLRPQAAHPGLRRKP